MSALVPAKTKAASLAQEGTVTVHGPPLTDLRFEGHGWLPVSPLLPVIILGIWLLSVLGRQ